MPVDGSQFPVNLVLRGRRVLVVGGGAIATNKVIGLLEGGADEITVVAPDISEEIETMPVKVERRAYETGDVEGHRLVITATDDADVNRRVFHDAEAAHVWVNSADDPANCSFTLPSRVRQGNLLVTFATGGHAPAVATWLRRRFESEFGQEYHDLLELVSAERQRIKAAGGSTEGLGWQEALDGGLLDLLRAGRHPEAQELLRTCLSSS